MVISMMLLALAAGPAATPSPEGAAAGAGPDPDPIAELLDVTVEPQVESGSSSDTPLFAFEETELTMRGGMVWFSDDFGADPEPCAGALIEVPMPWLGHGVFGLPRDGLGLFASFTASEIDRDYAPPVLEPTGDLRFFNVGMNLSLFRNETWMGRIYGGYQHGDYGGVTDMRDGSAGLAGAGLGLRITGSLQLTWHGEFVFAHEGDQLIFNYAGLLVEF